MKRSTGLWMSIVAVAALAGCTKWGVFEDIGSDPHPPTLRVVGIRIVPPEELAPPAPEPTPPEPAPPEPTPPEPTPPPAAARAQYIPLEALGPAGLTVRSGDTIDISQEYADAGADVAKIRLRDRDGALSASITYAPEEVDFDGDGEPDVSLGTPEFFPGTKGTAHFTDGLKFDAAQLGPHRLEMWAEDSHESRSEKVEFVVTVTL